jgi:hypothetical protein
LNSLYEFLARPIGTKPIYVSLAVDAFTFSVGEARFHVKPQVWLNRVGPSTTIVATGDQLPPAGAELLQVMSPKALAVPPDVRQKALEAILFQGLKALAHAGTVQRPEIVFHNDAVLAGGFDCQQREALSKAASAAFGERERISAG